MSAGVSSLRVSQSEDVTVTEGDDAEISCCWENVEGRASVTWTKNETNNQTILLNVTSYSKSNCSRFKIENVTKQHSGIYVCTLTVDIPMLIKLSGNGTFIKVMSKEEKDDRTNNSKSKYTNKYTYI